MTERQSPSGAFLPGTIQAGQQIVTAAPVVVPNPGNGLLFGAGIPFTTSQPDEQVLGLTSVERSNAAIGGSAAYAIELDGLPVPGSPRTGISAAAGQREGVCTYSRIRVAVAGTHVLNVRATTALGAETIEAGALLTLFRDQ